MTEDVYTPTEDDQWWESLVEVACDKGHRIFIDDGDGGMYACPACAPLPSVKPSVEDVARALADDWNPDRDPILTAMFRDYAQTVLALLPGRTETEVRAEAWDEGAQAARNEDFLADDFVETPNPYRARS